MEGILKKIYAKICAFFLEKEFVFRFDIYDGTEESKNVYEQNVVEYEFFNQGTTLCVIGSGLFLYPEFAGISPSRIVLDIYNENDVTVYAYRFQPLDFIVKQKIIPGIEPDFTSVSQPFVAPPVAVAGQSNFNRLIVKSKVRANVRKPNA